MKKDYYQLLKTTGTEIIGQYCHTVQCILKDRCHYYRNSFCLTSFVLCTTNYGNAGTDSSKNAK